MSERPTLFADFVPGARMGAKTEVVSKDQLAQWAALYPWDAPKDGVVPSGLTTVLMMRAYLEAVGLRPPGNIHVRQQMRLHAPMRMGDPVTTGIACKAKELKGERRKIELAATGQGSDGTLLYEGIITLYWAA